MQMAGRTANILAGLAVILAPAWGSPPPPRDIPQGDQAAMLQELDAVEERQEQAAASSRKHLSTTLETAIRGGTQAAALLEEAMQNTTFEGKDNKAKSFSEWKSKNAGLLRSEQLQSAVAFHARYLLLGLQMRQPGKSDSTAESSFAYVRDYARLFADKKFLELPEPASNLLTKPAADGPIAKWLLLGDRLPAKDSWEPAAGNIDGILEKSVRPVWREKADLRLTSSWDLQIEFHGLRAESARLDLERKKFALITKPRLLFGRACDRAIQGQPNLAAKEILELIKAHPDHPDWPAWVAKLRAMLETKAPSGI